MKPGHQSKAKSPDNFAKTWAVRGDFVPSLLSPSYLSFATSSTTSISFPLQCLNMGLKRNIHEYLADVNPAFVNPGEQVLDSL